MGIRKVRMSVINQNVDTIPHFQMSLLSQIKIIRWNYVIYVQNKAFKYYFSQKTIQGTWRCKQRILIPKVFSLWSLLYFIVYMESVKVKYKHAKSSSKCRSEVWSIWRNCHFTLTAQTLLSKHSDQNIRILKTKSPILSPIWETVLNI